jgi:hypothetical protein
MKKFFFFRFLILITVVTFITLANPLSSALAAKPRIKPSVRTNNAGVSSSAISAVRLRPDRKAVIVTFLNLNKYQNVSYTLTYTANGIDQGVSGSISTAGQTSASRELLFGTCSKNVCTYHVGIRDMRLEITATTPSGSTIVKKYRIKV